MEDLKHSFEIKKHKLIETEKQLKKNKQELEKAIQSRMTGMTQLRLTRDDRNCFEKINVLNDKLLGFTDRLSQRLENVMKQMYDSSKLLKEGKPDQQMRGLDILRVMRAIENFSSNVFITS